jgi:hypothetical protein
MSDRQRDTALTKLEDIEGQFRAAKAEHEKLRVKRNRAVRAALRAGATHEQAAAVTRLTRGRIDQIDKPQRAKSTKRRPTTEEDPA